MAFVTRASGRRSIWLAAGFTAALMCVGGGLAAAGANKKLDSFGGSCSLQGTDTFDPPATNTLQPLTVVYDAGGTCSGTLNGREVSNAPVTVHSVARSNGSCPYAQTIEPGTGAISFAGGATIRYTVEFTSVLTEIYLTIHGQRSGSAMARATFLTPRTPSDTALKCAGEGAAEVPMDMTLITQSPLVSQRHAGRG
jgi:hypothetical protein